MAHPGLKSTASAKELLALLVRTEQGAETTFAVPEGWFTIHDIREGLVRGLESAQMGDVDTHHEAALSLQLLKRLQTQLQRYIDDAKVQKRKDEQDSWLDRARQSVAHLR